MADPHDFELNRTSDQPAFEPPLEPAATRPSALWLVVAALAVATAAAFYLAVNRNRAVPATAPAAAGDAERALAGQVKQLLALAEAYPDLKAGESFVALQRSLTEIEDHIQNARRYYNAVVRDLNTRIEQFPSTLVARPFGFRTEEFFGLADTAEGAVPRVDL